jgi:hypothetical protein
MVWDTGRTSKCLARTMDEPLFEYFPNSAAITPIPMPIPPPVPPGLTGLTRQTVTSLQVTVTVRDPGNPTIGAVPIVSRVTLINVLIGA